MVLQEQLLQTLIEKSVYKALEKHSSTTTTAQKEFYTRKELATLLNCSISTIYNWTALGKIQAYGIGNRVMYRKDEVTASLIKL
jgi:excisionase family DNA binding protein